MKRHDVVSKRRKPKRHDREKHHDSAVHRAKLIIAARGNFPVFKDWNRLAFAIQCNFVRVHLLKDWPQHGNRCVGLRHLPAHPHNKDEADQQEEQGGDAVLNPDHFVIS